LRLPERLVFQETDAKVTFYAFDPDNLSDGAGFLTYFEPDTTNLSRLQDSLPPLVRFYYQGKPVQSGIKMLRTEKLEIHLQDSSGLLLDAVEPAQRLIATITGSTEILLDNLSSSFLTDDAEFRSGRIVLPLAGLSSGVHTLQIQASDQADNTGYVALEFQVLAKDQLIVFPTPARQQVRFQFSLPDPGSNQNFRVELLLSDLTGNRVYQSVHKVNQAEALGFQLLFDRDIYNLKDGLYFFEVKIDLPGFYSNRHLGKLMFSRE
jgi:hypothetical protein